MPFKGKPGVCIADSYEQRTETDLFEKLKRLGSPSLSDGLNKFNTMDAGIKPIVGNCAIAGRAVTLRLRAADNLMMHMVLGMLRPGDVLVIDTCGCTTNSVLGDLLATAAFRTGVEGIIVDGGIRDIVELREARYPIFARFVTPAVGDKDGPGEINRPISCGGVPVLPGDYILADDNGIVVIPPDMAEQVIGAAERKLSYEDKRREQIVAGILVMPEITEKVNKLLK